MIIKSLHDVFMFGAFVWSQCFVLAIISYIAYLISSKIKKGNFSKKAFRLFKGFSCGMIVSCTIVTLSVLTTCIIK